MKIVARAMCVMVLIISMILLQAGISLAQPPDIQGHWAEKQIVKWVDKGLVKGYQNGIFKPDADITRAEFMALVNRAFGFTGGAKANISDVSQKDWFAADVARAMAAGYISGYKDGTVRPNNNISRQEAAIMLARILKLDASAGNSEVNKFIDAKAIPLWSKGDIEAVVDKGLMNGYPDHTFQPEGYMTRAEVIVILDRALDIKQKVTDYDQTGTYGSQSGMNVVDGSVTISSADVTLINTKITGDLILTEAIGKGTVSLKNVTVQGNTIVQGGGPNSVKMDNFNGKTVEVDVPDSFNVRLVAQGNTSVTDVVMKSGGKLEESGLTGSGFSTVTVSKDAQVVLAGDFDTVNVEAGNASVNMESGKVANLNIAKTATGTEINLSGGTGVGILTVNATASIKGQGQITTANINTSGVSIQQNPANTNISSGIIASIAGRQQTGNTSGNRSGGSSGGGGGGGIYSTATTPGTLIVTPVSVDNNTTQTITLTYALGEDFNIGSVEFRLPAEIMAAADQDTVTVNGPVEAGLESEQIGNEGRNVYITGITANQGDIVKLTLTGKKMPAPDLYTFSVIADADGEAANKAATLGSGSEAVNFMVTEPTAAGTLSIDPVSADTGTTQTFKLTYALGENFNDGLLEFCLPAGIPVDVTDMLALPGESNIQIGVVDQVYKVYVTGITAETNRSIVLTLFNKKVPAPGSYTFSVIADADGEAALKSKTSGSGSEAVNFSSNSLGSETGTQEDLIRNFIQAINDKDATKAESLLSQDICYVEKYSDGTQMKIDTSDGMKNYIDDLLYDESKLTIDNIQRLDTTTLVVYGTASSYVTETVGITNGIRYTMKFTSKEGKISYLEFQQNSEDEKLLIQKTEGIIGVYLEDDNGTLKIKDFVPGLPAEKAGLLKGDIIEAVDGLKITDMKYGVKEALDRISGVVGTKVKLTVNRNGTIFDKEVERVKYNY